MKKDDALTARLREALKKDFAALEKAERGLGEKMLRYVATGAPEELLEQLSELEDAVGKMGLNDRGPGPLPIVALMDELSPATALRYAKCLEATYARTPFSYSVGSGWEMANWLEVLLFRAAGIAISSSIPEGTAVSPALTADHIERMLVADGDPPETFIEYAFVEAAPGASTAIMQVASRMGGFAESAVRHHAAAVPAFHAKGLERRIHALDMLRAASPEMFEAYAPQIAACLVANEKALRLAAEPIARAAGAAMRAPLQEIAVKGATAARVLALQALWDLGAHRGVAGAKEFVLDRAAEEKTRSVLDAIRDLQSRDAASAQAEPQELAVPELPSIDCPPLPDSLRPAFDQCIARINALVEKALKESDRDSANALSPVTADEADAVWSYVAGRATRGPSVGAHLQPWWIADEVLQEMQAFLKIDPIAPVHITRLYEALRGDEGRYRDELTAAFEKHYAAHRRPTFLEMEALMVPRGFPAESIANAFMGDWEFRLGEDWEHDHVWPYFARHMDVVRKWVARDFGNDYVHDPTVGFRALARFPRPPAEFVPHLFDLALGTAKGDRVLAQMALEKLPNKEERLIAALGESKADTRANAADWLRRLKSSKAVPALEAALRKESNDLCIGAMLSALEVGGGDVTKFLDRDALPKEAAKGLAKGIPSAIEWFPWSAMPEVRWSAGGERVPPDVLKWFLVQAAKLKSPEPQPLLRRYCAMFEPADRERFGQFVFDAWHAEDLAPIERAEAERLATEYANAYHGGGVTEEQLYASILPKFLRQPRGSAQDARGLLAVAAACAGRGVAAPSLRYLKEYYGTRIHQGKALIGMLAWVDHPVATQAMLSVGHRFRTKQLQEEAMRQAEALAERRGWSVAELADRTMPTAGFDENGELELSYGAERAFTARLGDEYKVELCNAEGKKISSLPEPRKDEDEELAKEAKKAFSAAKKDVKAIVQLQSQRLYEALCTERSWRFEDWDLYLNRHPIVRRLLQGLVWVELGEGRVARSFRPLDDGTLSDIDDNAVTLDPEARVGLAHDTNLDAAAVAAWRKHLGDYKVATPFQQLGKGVYVLPEKLRDESAIPDFAGHVINGLALRGAAGKLGYQRGDPEGRAWVFDYRKRFPSLGVEAVVGFSGNDVYDEDVDVQLESLSFARNAEGKKSGSSLRLSTVPAVLLSECYNDMRLIAGVAIRTEGKLDR